MFGKEHGSHWGHLRDVGTVVPERKADLFLESFQKDLILPGLVLIKVDAAITAIYPFNIHSLCMIQGRDIGTLLTKLIHTKQLRIHMYTLVYACVHLHNELLNCSLRHYRREAPCTPSPRGCGLGGRVQTSLRSCS